MQLLEIRNNIGMPQTDRTCKPAGVGVGDKVWHGLFSVEIRRARSRQKMRPPSAR